MFTGIITAIGTISLNIIGSNFVIDWLAATGEEVVNLDVLTYAGNPDNLAGLKGDSRHVSAQCGRIAELDTVSVGT